VALPRTLGGAASLDSVMRLMPKEKAIAGKLNSQRVNLMFRAFSDATRLRILRVLQGGECCVGDLVSILRLAQPSVSRHLAYLKKAQLVTVRKQGLWCHYALTRTNGGFHKNLLHCLESCFNEVPDLQADAQRAAEIRGAGGCCPDENK
jgi:ArsR family transcriptional regulator, arsenate/arsenite/antimonite-responsive transcriptional repressor